MRMIPDFLPLTFMIFAGLGGPAAAQQAAYNPGFRLAVVRAGGDVVQLAVWYPTRSSFFLGHRVGVFRLRVAKDAPPAPGRFGLIAISHGTGGGFLNHRSTARALARVGFVVVAPHHPGSNWQDGSRIGSRMALARRPRHLSGAITWALRDRRLGPLIDRHRIGAIGYSAGGFTVMAALGARGNLAYATIHCRRHPQDNRFCAFERLRQQREGQVGLRQGWLPRHRDRRIRAVALWAPLGAMFGLHGMRQISATILIMRAGQDEILKHPWHAHRIHLLLQRAGVRHRYVRVPRAGHYAFVTPFPLLARPFAGEANHDPAGFDRARFSRQLGQIMVRYFTRALR